MAEKDEVKTCAKCPRVGVPQDDDLCKYHQIERDEGPEAAREWQKEMSSKGGVAATGGARAVDVAKLPQLEGHAEVKRWLSFLAAGVASGKVDPDLSGEVRRILKVWMKAHRGEVTDEVVDELRDKLEDLERRVERPWES